jgi:hypothetical protein
LLAYILDWRKEEGMGAGEEREGFGGVRSDAKFCVNYIGFKVLERLCPHLHRVETSRKRTRSGQSA